MRRIIKIYSNLSLRKFKTIEEPTIWLQKTYKCHNLNLISIEFIGETAVIITIEGKRRDIKDFYIVFETIFKSKYRMKLSCSKTIEDK